LLLALTSHGGPLGLSLLLLYVAFDIGLYSLIRAERFRESIGKLLGIYLFQLALAVYMAVLWGIKIRLFAN
jgi:hypothetical protein